MTTFQAGSQSVFKQAEILLLMLLCISAKTVSFMLPLLFQSLCEAGAARTSTDMRIESVCELEFTLLVIIN